MKTEGLADLLMGDDPVIARAYETDPLSNFKRSQYHPGAMLSSLEGYTGKPGEPLFQRMFGMENVKPEMVCQALRIPENFAPIVEIAPVKSWRRILKKLDPDVDYSNLGTAMLRVLITRLERSTENKDVRSILNLNQRKLDARQETPEFRDDIEACVSQDRSPFKIANLALTLIDQDYAKSLKLLPSDRYGLLPTGFAEAVVLTSSEA